VAPISRHPKSEALHSDDKGDIAPTDEIPMLASAVDDTHLMTLVGLSLLISYGIVVASG
jgi:uncharacterized membrane protein